jgi:hypothetical protein
MAGYVCSEHHELVTWRGTGCEPCTERRADCTTRRAERRTQRRNRVAALRKPTDRMEIYYV